MESMLDSLMASSPAEVKRRGLRKGTFSCWECKRRKMKCVFETSSGTAPCNGCRRRGTKCIGQEVPEEVVSQAKDARTTPLPQDAPQSTALPGTPLSFISEYTPQSREFSEATTHPWPSTLTRQTLSQRLHASLPTKEETDLILQAKPYPSVLVHEIMTTPYTTLLEDGRMQDNDLLQIPSSNAHPVLIAKHMLLLVSLLQHLHTEFDDGMKQLSQPPHDMAVRLLDVAVDAVTTKEDQLGSVEALECIIMESVCHANVGNLRRSWLASRRAISTAEMMGLHRPSSNTNFHKLDPKSHFDPEMTFFRITFLDRFLSLLLGLPSGCNVKGMTPTAIMNKEVPMQQIERVHCAVASHILEQREAESTVQDISVTQDLDQALQKAARDLDSRWWAIPRHPPSDSQALMQDTRRLYAQILHFNLLNQLHLPYLMSSGKASEYSKFTCVNSSREILNRFMALRDFNGIAYSCRIIDFIALMAAMTLLLAHLSASQSPEGSVLAHQYQSDRAMIEQVEDNMRDTRLVKDPLSVQSADLLHRLLALEGDPTRTTVNVHPGAEVPSAPNSESVRIHIPYFGVIGIDQRGVSRQGLDERIKPLTTLGSHGQPTPASEPSGSIPSAISNTPTESVVMQQSTRQDGWASADIPMTPLGTQHGNALSSAFPQLLEYPALAATTEDWALQGVDGAFFSAAMEENTMSFFDSVMKSADANGGQMPHWSSAAEMHMTG